MGFMALPAFVEHHVELSTRTTLAHCSGSTFADQLDRSACPALGCCAKPGFVLGGGNLVLSGDFDGLRATWRSRDANCCVKNLIPGSCILIAGENWHDFVQWTLAQRLAGTGKSIADSRHSGCRTDPEHWSLRSGSGRPLSFAGSVRHAHRQSAGRPPPAYPLRLPRQLLNRAGT